VVVPGQRAIKWLLLLLLLLYNGLKITHALVAINKGMWAVILLQQNPPVLNWGYWLMQIVLYNGSKTVAVVVVVIVVVVVVVDNGLISNN